MQQWEDDLSNVYIITAKRQCGKTSLIRRILRDHGDFDRGIIYNSYIHHKCEFEDWLDFQTISNRKDWYSRADLNYLKYFVKEQRNAVGFPKKAAIVLDNVIFGDCRSEKMFGETICEIAREAKALNIVLIVSAYLLSFVPKPFIELADTVIMRGHGRVGGLFIYNSDMEIIYKLFEETNLTDREILENLRNNAFLVYTKKNRGLLQYLAWEPA